MKNYMIKESPKQTLNVSLLENNTEGIYELSSNKIEKYPYSKNNILYMSSSKNIKKRLSTYTQTAHSENIRTFMRKKKISILE